MRDSDLDDLLAEARAAAPAPSAALMARIEADGLRLQPRAAAPVAPRAVPRRPGFLASVIAAVGGARGLAGLATAAAAGLWIGIAQPFGLGTLADGLGVGSAAAGFDSVELIPALDPFAAEG